jgi:hypothetical protein
MNIFGLFASRYTQRPNVDARKQPQNADEGNKHVEVDKARFESVLIKRGVPPQVIETLFKTMDVNGDGKINGNDFQRVLQMHAQSVRQTEPQQSKKETETVKNAAVNNAPPPETEQTPINPQTTTQRKEYAAAATAKKIFTYNKNGNPHLPPVSTYVNTLV